MANGADSDEYVVLSKVRPGLKRELAFALKSQAEYGASYGRSRTRKSQTGNLGDEVLNDGSSKRFKSSQSKIETEKLSGNEFLVSDTEKSMNVGVSVSEDEPKSDIVDMTSDDEHKELSVESAVKVVDTKVEIVEPCCSDSPDGEDLAKEGLESPSPGVIPMVSDNSSPKFNSHPVHGAVGKDFYEKPTRRVTRSAVKVMEEPSEISTPVNVRTEEAVKKSAMGKLEMHTSKKIELKRFPTKLKELLETGLLEGLPVRYIRGVKSRIPSDTGMQGIIKDAGILCYCSLCLGTKVVTPNQFELHAGSSNKRPPEYIFLENGNTLRDVLNACKVAPLESLEEAIRKVAGCSSEKQTVFCLSCKGTISEAGSARAMLLCSPCLKNEESMQKSAPLSDRSDSSRSPSTAVIPKSSGRVSNSVLRLPSTAVNPKPSESASCSSSRSKPQGRLTRKDLRMHKLVFQDDALPDGTELAYYARGQKCAKGYKKGSGIFCFCCQSEVSPSQFEAHAGWASRRKPYLHIYTSNGVSLHELSIELSKSRKLSAEENDDLCSICQDGGDLLCCDNCPRAFHTECVSLPAIPNGTWYCKYCLNLFQKEKFVERNANAVAAGRIAGVDPIQQITMRCIRIIESVETEVGGCALCRSHDFSKTFGPRTVIICDQCEKEYHVGCLKEHGMDDLKELPSGKWFCCTNCDRIHSSLQNLVISGEEKLPLPLLNIIKKKLEENDVNSNADLDIRWRLLRGKMTSEDDETRILLSKAVSIFHDRFDPIADSSTGRLDLIPHMVYGRSVMDQDFGGMHCAVLSVNSNIVCAGIFRILGEEVAELPLVATSTDFQGQGYFQVLFACVENLLGSLGVKDLVLPAADEAGSIWTKRFGFEKFAEDELTKLRKDYHQLMIFQGTSMLHKPVTVSG